MDYAAFKDNEQQGWGHRASDYHDTTARATHQSVPALLAQSQLFPRAKLLDAGCGPGHVAACASLLGAQASGVDFSAEMVAEARKRFPHLDFQLGDIEQLSAADNQFDTVLSNFVLFHVTNPAAVMAETRRVLKPGGRFAFSQWLGPDQSPCYQLLFQVLQQHADMSRANPAPDAYLLSDPATADEMMRDAGFHRFHSETVQNVLHAPGPSFFNFFMRFGVRVPLLVAGQTPQVQARIKAEIDRLASRYLDRGTYKIPMPSVVYAASAA